MQAKPGLYFSVLPRKPALNNPVFWISSEKVVSPFDFRVFFFLSEWGPPGAGETAGGDSTTQQACGCVMNIQPTVTESQGGFVCRQAAGVV